jgi:hypothetical protein
MNHHIVPTRALSLDFRVDAPPAIGSGPRRLVHNRYIVENWNLGWLAYCIFGSIVSTEKLRAALEGRWIVGSLDRWIDVGFVEPQSRRKALPPPPPHARKQERGSQRCINIIEEHTSVCNYYSLIDHLERRNSSRGQPIFQPILEKLLRDDLLRFTGGQRLLAFSIFANDNFPRRGRSREHRRHLWGSTFTEVFFGGDSSRFV